MPQLISWWVFQRLVVSLDLSRVRIYCLLTSILTGVEMNEDWRWPDTLILKRTFKSSHWSDGILMQDISSIRNLNIPRQNEYIENGSLLNSFARTMLHFVISSRSPGAQKMTVLIFLMICYNCFLEFLSGISPFTPELPENFNSFQHVIMIQQELEHRSWVSSLNHCSRWAFGCLAQIRVYI